MEDEGNVKMTSFDRIVQNKNLQLIKAAIPHMNSAEQKFLSVYVKVLELMNAVSLVNNPEESVKICSVEQEGEPTLNMLNDIRCYCSETEKESIDLLINFMNAYQLYRTYKASADSPEGAEDSMLAVRSMLTPEQQSMFETYKTLFGT